MFLLTFCSVARSFPYVEVVDAPPAGWDEHDRLLEAAAGRAPADATSVRVLYRRDGVVLTPEEVLGTPLPPPPRPGERLPREWPANLSGRVEGALSGRAVYLSQCHGWLWDDENGNWDTQRGNVHDTIEDFHNPEGANQFLAAYLENAGATVFATRERDMNPLWDIVDDGGDGFTSEGAWTVSPGGFEPAPSWAFGENPFDGSSRVAEEGSGAKAVWTPVVPEDGWYNLYVTWQDGPDRSPGAHYRITHPGGVSDRRFDQRVHGTHWRYVDHLWLDAGASLTVELLADGDAGTTVSADAVRIGGGMGVVSRDGTTTARPRWEEGAIYALQFDGAPLDVYDPWWSGNGSDPSVRSRWAAWQHPIGEPAVYLSWHSNAYVGTARGTVTYYAGDECSTSATEGSLQLTELVQEELIGSFRAQWDSAWSDRGIKTACFSEVSPSNNPEMPAALVELAFHDNEEDAWYLKHPRFRRDAARAMYRGVARYFGGDGTTFLPEPPSHVRVVHEGGSVVARWSPGPSGAPLGDVATSYWVQTSKDGRAWDEGFAVDGASAELDIAPGETRFVRVMGRNPGGVSFASPVVGARRAESAARVLVVDAFDRLDSGLLDVHEPSARLGWVVTMNLHRMNAYDTAVAHGLALAEAGLPFDTTTDEAFADLELSAYDLVVWAAGEESVGDETVDATQQESLRAFVVGGGALWVSGAEVLWDLDANGEPSDIVFVQEVLGARYAADDAGVDVAFGEGVLDGLELGFGPSYGGPYPVEWPDVLGEHDDVLARYPTGEIAASRTGAVVLFGFPFEAIGDRETRTQVTSRLVSALAPQVFEEPRGASGLPFGRSSFANGCGCDAGVAPLGGGLLPVLVLTGVWASRRPGRCILSAGPIGTRIGGEDARAGRRRAYPRFGGTTDSASALARERALSDRRQAR